MFETTFLGQHAGTLLSEPTNYPCLRLHQGPTSIHSRRLLVPRGTGRILRRRGYTPMVIRATVSMHTASLDHPRRQISSRLSLAGQRIYLQLTLGFRILSLRWVLIYSMLQVTLKR